jgi:DNA-binding FadR family transcriptional regulator
VATHLASDLFSGAYRPGDLPSQGNRSGHGLRVSRASVRSGLQTLVSLGIIRRQSGQGTVVNEYRDWNVLDPMGNRLE